MCGLAGSYTPGRARPISLLQSEADRMSRAIAHRGPDGDGCWLSEVDGLALAHRRLAIFGLGETGSQPMRSGSGRYILIFNGAIYNYIELRDELRSTGISFRGESDTEVLLAVIEESGLDVALEKCVGMFALALWDCEHKRLQLARDRLGEKPLFYSFSGGELRFGSELAVFNHARLNTCAVESFLDYGFSPDVDTVLDGVAAVPPGCIVDACISSDRPVTHEFWKPTGRADSGQLANSESIVDELETRLRDAIRLQLRADVPLGLFLSGGMDSTLVATIASQLSDSALPSFSVGFEDDRFNELPTAIETAKRLGLKHHSFVLDDASILDHVTQWFDGITEPLADPSIIPTRALTAFAREHVTTVITGDGGDELFAGYERYRSGAALWRLSQKVPGSVSSFASLVAQKIPGPVLDRLGQLLGGRSNVEEPSRRINKALSTLAARDYESLHRALVAKTPLTRRTNAQSTAIDDAADLIGRLMDDDLKSYLPASVLTKLDRTAMSVGLEARAPFLDHRLVQWSQDLPINLLVDDKEGKKPVRELVSRLGGSDIARGVKRGFSPPLAAWLRGPLSEYWRDTLNPDTFDDWPVDARDRVKNLSSVGADDVRGREYEIWHALTLAAWHRQHKAVSCG